MVNFWRLKTTEGKSLEKPVDFESLCMRIFDILLQSDPSSKRPLNYSVMLREYQSSAYFNSRYNAESGTYTTPLFVITPRNSGWNYYELHADIALSPAEAKLRHKLSHVLSAAFSDAYPEYTQGLIFLRSKRDKVASSEGKSMFSFVQSFEAPHDAEGFKSILQQNIELIKRRIHVRCLEMAKSKER